MQNHAKKWLRDRYPYMSEAELEHRVNRYGINPCLSGEMRLLTIDGYQTFESLENTEPYIINAEGDVVKSKVWCSGEKETIKLKLTNKRNFICTSDHKLLTIEGEFLAEDCKGRQLMPYLKEPEHDKEFVMLGFVQGDGCTTQMEQNIYGIRVNIGKLDHDILSVFTDYDYEWDNDRAIIVGDIKELLFKHDFVSAILPERPLPLAFDTWNKNIKAAFLNGLYSANGCVIINAGRVALKTTCEKLAEQVKTTLADVFEIEAYITTNKTKLVEFSNGVYQCRQSYDVNIAKFDSKVKFFNEINFSLLYRTEKLANSLFKTCPTVRKIEADGIKKVYDFIEPLTHWGVVDGFVTHNCG